MRTDWTAETSRTVDLGYDQLLVLEARSGTRVRVLYGNLWLTEEGTAQDVFAGSGTEIMLNSRGRAVIEGLGAARVQVIEPRGRAMLKGATERLRGLLAPLRSLRMRAQRWLHA